MSTRRMRKAAEGEQEDLKMDMSPMIDMVFLLLIFFMVTSRIIVLRQDPDVEPPVADNAQPLAVAEGRIVINILETGLFRDIDGNELTAAEIETLCRDTLQKNKENGIATTRLHLRGDRNAIVREMKRVVDAAAKAGISEVVFATYRVNRYE